MKTKIYDNIFDTKLEASDWRFSAIIIGLIKYFDYNNIDYEADDDYILYNADSIKEEKYFKFAEYKYNNQFHHKFIENTLLDKEIDEELIKEINKKLVSNNIMKKCFKKVKFDGTNKEDILKIIEENRLELIKETFRTKKNMYDNYANKNLLFKNANDYCRLNGYYVDSSKKGKSASFNFNMKSFSGQDMIEMDFVPFAFLGETESFFINDNFSINNLKLVNEVFEKSLSYNNSITERKIDSRQALFKEIVENDDFIISDVEVILKNIDKKSFETILLRQKNIEIIKEIKNNNINYEALFTYYKVNESYYINILKEVMDNIVNNLLLDNLIEFCLKINKPYIAKQLIKINLLIKGENIISNKNKEAYKYSKIVSQILNKSKLEYYKKRLINYIVLNENYKFVKTLSEISNNLNIEFKFIYHLLDDFENNKELAYIFVNELNKKEER